MLGAHLLAHPRRSRWHFQALLIFFILGLMGAVQLGAPLLGWPCRVLLSQAGRDSSLVHGMAFSPLAAYSGISSELSIFFQEHFRRKSSFMLCYRFFPASILTFSTHPQVCLKTVHFSRVPPELHRGQRAPTWGWCWLPSTTECTAGLPRNISGCARHCWSSSSASIWLSKAELLRSEGRQE